MTTDARTSREPTAGFEEWWSNQFQSSIFNDDSHKYSGHAAREAMSIAAWEGGRAPLLVEIQKMEADGVRIGQELHRLDSQLAEMAERLRSSELSLQLADELSEALYYVDLVEDKQAREALESFRRSRT